MLSFSEAEKTDEQNAVKTRVRFFLAEFYFYLIKILTFSADFYIRNWAGTKNGFFSSDQNSRLHKLFKLLYNIF